MTHHAYIDESGTEPEHGILTVALVVLEGAGSANKIHLNLSKAAFKAPKSLKKAEITKWYAKQKLHYCDMSDQQKSAAGDSLHSANIRAFIAQHHHKDNDLNHDSKFKLYKTLVGDVVAEAFQHFGDLEICIAKQGGWESYGKEFLAELNSIPKSISISSNFKKGTFHLASTSNVGLQIADFYASSGRAFLLDGSKGSMSGPYEKIQNQVTLLSVRDTLIIH